MLFIDIILKVIFFWVGIDILFDFWNIMLGMIYVINICRFFDYG